MKLPTSFAETFRAWQTDPEPFLEAMRAVPGAYFWELPPLVTSRLDDPFECVFVPSRSLAGIRADPTPFRDHFDHTEVVTFDNLGGDAILVAPTPRGGDCAHLAAFVRTAPKSQQHALLAAIASAAKRRIGGRPVWISTSGLGVYWLHVRLDDRPKYYTHQPYRRS